MAVLVTDLSDHPLDVLRWARLTKLICDCHPRTEEAPRAANSSPACRGPLATLGPQGWQSIRGSSSTYVGVA